MARSRQIVHDPYAPNLEEIRDEIIAMVRPRLKSNADSIATIRSTHASMAQEGDFLNDQCHKSFQRNRRTRELNAITTDRLVNVLREANADPEVIEVATRTARTARAEMNRMTRLKEAGLQPQLPEEPRSYRSYPRAPRETLEQYEEVPPRPPERYNTPHRQETPGMDDVPFPEPIEYDGILKFVTQTLERNKDRPDKSPLTAAGVKVPPPSAWEGSQDLDEFEAFVAKVVGWMEMNNLLRPNCTHEQLLLMEICLKGDAGLWYYDAVRRSSRQWDLLSVIKGLQERFIPATAHHKAATLFHATKQGTKTVQELKNSLDKYAERMVSKPDAYTFRLRFLEALHPSIRNAVLRNGYNAENSYFSVLYKDALKYESAFKYEQTMRGTAHDDHKSSSGKPEEKKATGGKIPSRPTWQSRTGHAPTRPTPRTGTGQPGGAVPYVPRTAPFRPMAKPPGEKPLPMAPPKATPVVTGATAPAPVGGGAPLRCFECNQLGHSRYYCPKLRNGVRTAGVRFDENQSAPQEEDTLPTEDTAEGAAYPEYQLGEWYSGDEDPYQEDESGQPYIFDEDAQPDNVEEDLDVMDVRVVRYPDYDERRENLLLEAEPTVTRTVAAVAKVAPPPVEPLYDHRARIKERPRPPRGHTENKVFTVLMNLGGVVAHCLLDSGCEGVMVAADFARAARLPIKPLEKPVTLQLACQGSKSMVNHGLTTDIDVGGQVVKEYFDVANVDYYDAILGMPFLRRFQVTLDFSQNGSIRIGNNSYAPGKHISLNTINKSGVLYSTQKPRTQR